MWFNPNPRDYGVNKIKSTLPEDASTQLSAFLGK